MRYWLITQEYQNSQKLSCGNTKVHHIRKTQCHFRTTWVSGPLLCMACPSSHWCRGFKGSHLEPSLAASWAEPWGMGGFGLTEPSQAVTIRTSKGPYFSFLLRPLSFPPVLTHMYFCSHHFLCVTDCPTWLYFELKTGCTCRVSCTRGSIPQITCMCPSGLFQRIFHVTTSPLQSLLVPRLRNPSSDGETTVPSLLMKPCDEWEPPSGSSANTWTVDEPTVP